MRDADCIEMRERRFVLTCRPPCSSPGNLCGCYTKAHAEHRLYRDEGDKICADLSPTLQQPWESLWLLHQGTRGTDCTEIPTFRNLSQRPRHLISQGVWCLIRPSSWSLLVQGCRRWHFEFCGTTRRCLQPAAAL